MPDLSEARIIDLMGDVLTVEARMTSLAAKGSAIRQELTRRGVEAVARDGVAPTWRALDKLGSVVFTNPEPKPKVVERDDFGSWAAEHYPTEVTGVLSVPADMLPVVLELLSSAAAKEALGVWQPKIELTINDRWLKGWLENRTTVLDHNTVCENISGQIIPGVAMVTSREPGVSVRLNPEAKARAAAELEDPQAMAVLTAPLGAIAGVESGGLLADDVDPAEGEPEYSELPPVPLDPVGAAVHATTLQGGFSTPAIEAGRILSDALRLVDLGAALDERWRNGIRTTLAWIKGNPSAEVDGELARLSARHPGDWIGVLQTAVAAAELLPVATTTSPVEVAALRELAEADLPSLLVPALREHCRLIGLASTGVKPALVRRLSDWRASQLLQETSR